MFVNKFILYKTFYLTIFKNNKILTIINFTKTI